MWGHFYNWLYLGKGDEATKTQAISAAVQAAAAVILLVVTCYYAYVTRRSLDAAETQAVIANKQFELGVNQFRASMIPRLCLKVYPTDNYQYIAWEIRNNSLHDLLIKGAEIRWNLPGYEWTHVLDQYPGGVFAAGDALTSTEYNAVAIPGENFPKDRPMLREDVIRMLTISFTVSDVAEILSFRFEFTPGKGQKVTVSEHIA